AGSPGDRSPIRGTLFVCCALAGKQRAKSKAPRVREKIFLVMGFLFTLFISTPRHPILPREILIYLSLIPSSFCASLRIDRSSTSVTEISRPTFASFKTNPDDTRIMSLGIVLKLGRLGSKAL